FRATTRGVHRADKVQASPVNRVVSVPARPAAYRQKEQRLWGRMCRQGQPRRSVAAGWSRKRARPCLEGCSVPSAGGSQRKSGRPALTLGRRPGTFTEPTRPLLDGPTSVVSAAVQKWTRRQKEQRPRRRMRRQTQPRRNIAANSLDTRPSAETPCP